MLTVPKSKLTNILLVLLSTITFQSYAIESNKVNVAEQLVDSTQTQAFTQAELEQMLAPIALYPDTLLTHILIASTYPIEVVDAERWLRKNQHLSDQERLKASEDQDWDPSVKALLPFPKILENLSEDLHWMRNLGDAFLQDEAQVLASVQALRQRADEAGNLEKMDNVKVVRETKTIIIEPIQPEVIYVPYYDTRVIYGPWRWAYYPPVYWHYPTHYSYNYGPYYWYNPVHVSVGLLFGAVHWNNHHVVVHHHNSYYYNKNKHHSNTRVSTSYQAQRWQHNPRHRKGVAYRSSTMQKQYRSYAPSAQRSKYVRNQQKHAIKNQAVKTSYYSSKHQQTKRNLQVNQARSIDKHKMSKNSNKKSKYYSDKKPAKIYSASRKQKPSNRARVNKVEPYKNSNWDKSHNSKKQYAKPAKTYSKASNHSQTHRPAKSYQAKSSSPHKQVARVRSSPGRSQSVHRSQHRKHN